MQFSDLTLEVLKNYAGINPGISIKAGNELRTISANKTLLAEASVPDTFPTDFCVHDLNNFLAVLSMYKEKPELTFDDKNIIIKGGKSKITYRCCDENVILVPPSKRISVTPEETEVSFQLSENDLQWILKVSNLLQAPNLVVSGDGTKLTIKVTDVQNDSSHTDIIDIGETDKTFEFIFKAENFKIISGTYDVSIKLKEKKGISLFQHTTKNVFYFIALEIGSSNSETE